MSGLRKKEWMSVRSLSFIGGMVLASCVAMMSGCSKSDGSSANGTATASNEPPDAETGAVLYKTACVNCHGAIGQGMPHQGIPLRTSPFVASKTDAQLIEFIQVGRGPREPDNHSGNPMPPSGGIPNLSKERTADIVAFLRKLQADAKTEAAANAAFSTTAPATQPIMK